MNMYFSRSAVAALLARQTGGLRNNDSYNTDTIMQLLAAVTGGALVLVLAASFVSVLI